jgi:hypothetical protein
VPRLGFARRRLFDDSSVIIAWWIAGKVTRKACDEVVIESPYRCAHHPFKLGRPLRP